jgi:hypothetical protein
LLACLFDFLVLGCGGISWTGDIHDLGPLLIPFYGFLTCCEMFIQNVCLVLTVIKKYILKFNVKVKTSNQLVNNNNN